MEGIVVLYYMTAEQFNDKWDRFLPDGWYGMDLNDEKAIEVVDKHFEDEFQHIEGFQFYQIKMKWGSSRVYTNLGTLFNDVGLEMEQYVENIINLELKIDAV